MNWNGEGEKGAGRRASQRIYVEIEIYALEGGRGEELTKQAGVTEALKAQDQMTWVQSMNALQAQAEETILSELIYA